MSRTKTHLGVASALLLGGAAFIPSMAQFDGSNGRGYEIVPPNYTQIGAPKTALSTGLINAATGAELPNAATITYTAATDGVSPLDNAGRASVIPAYHTTNGVNQIAYGMDVARNVSLVVTHASSIVACTCLVTGADLYGQPQTELLSVTATGTTKTVAGKKAWGAIISMAITSAGNAQANTLNLGWGNALGLALRISKKSQLTPYGNDALDTSGTIVVADDTSPATNVTGDVRGTYTPSSAPDATKTYEYYLTPTAADRGASATLFGVTPV